MTSFSFLNLSVFVFRILNKVSLFFKDLSAFFKKSSPPDTDLCLISFLVDGKFLLFDYFSDQGFSFLFFGEKTLHEEFDVGVKCLVSLGISPERDFSFPSVQVLTNKPIQNMNYSVLFLSISENELKESVNLGLFKPKYELLTGQELVCRKGETIISELLFRAAEEYALLEFLPEEVYVK